jgi:hypothetical protein
MKKEICVCDQCGKDLKEELCYLILKVSLSSYKGQTFWALGTEAPKYAGEHHFCNGICLKEFLK